MHATKHVESENPLGVEPNRIQPEISTKHFSLTHTVVFAIFKTVYIVYFIKLKPIGRWIKQVNYFRTIFHFINYRTRKTFKCL